MINKYYKSLLYFSVSKILTMKKIFLSVLIVCFNPSNAQQLNIPSDTIVKTYHKTLIKGVEINYSAEAGMQPVWNNKGEVIAAYFILITKESLKKFCKK